MKKNVYFLNGNNDVYNKIITESVMEELIESFSEVQCGYYKTIRDAFKADALIVCGDGNVPLRKLWPLMFFRKPLVLYHVADNAKLFRQCAKKSKWTVTATEEDGYEFYPSPVLLSDLATSKRISRIWRGEKLVSKRGCIGIIGIDIDEKQQKQLASVLDLLVEDLDLNIVFIPILKNDPIVMKDILAQIKFSANTRYIAADKYSSSELLGLISRADILLTSDYRAAICAMPANRPVVGLKTEKSLSKLLSGVVQEDVLFDMEKLSNEEIYTKIKIAWVHRDAIREQMHSRIEALKVHASDGIRSLGRKVTKGF